MEGKYMNILGIDTTTKNAAVSLMYNNKMISKSIDNQVTHSEKLLPLIDEILNENNIDLKDIDLYACINGPGSFTGIRIGLSTLKAFSFVDNKSIFSISSTDLIAFVAYINSNYLQNNSSADIISMIDAKNDRIYYSLNNLCMINNKIEIQNKIATSNDLIDNVLNTLDTNLENVIFAGDAINKFKEKIENKFSNAYLLDFYPTTDDLILAYNKINNTQNYMYDTYTLDANYARASQAERLLKNES
jgi:tRNA threonylcarbamoyladenosine biosynthesis protein TsaB